MDFTRKYAGFYVAEAETTVERDGAKQRIPVKVRIRYMPEWRGAQKWTLEIEGAILDYTVQLENTSDTMASSYREAKELAENAVANGWTYVRGLGWCGRLNA